MLATQFIRVKRGRQLAVLHSATTAQDGWLGVVTIMLNSLAQFAKKLWARLATAANQVFRHITQPAQSNLVTGTLADLPRSRSELLAENALLRRQLIVLHRQMKTPRLTWRERLALLFLAR